MTKKMFGDILRAVSRLDPAQLPSEIPEDIVQLLPDEIAVQDLVRLLTENTDDPIASLSATRAIFQSGRRLSHSGNGSEDDALNEIADRISSAILPVSTGASPDEDTTDCLALSQKGALGLQALHSLLTQAPQLRYRAPTLLCIAAYTDAADPWTRAESTAQLARDLLASQLSQRDRDARAGFVTEAVLVRFLRPLFSASRPATVTASGRKAEFAEAQAPGHEVVERESAEAKPWKYGQRYAVTVFGWAVRQADKELLRQHWHMYTPVLLTLLDEAQPALRIRALGILRAFWARCPAGLLRDTGLAEVFEQAVFPTVLYLPSLTPEDESVALLDAAYPVLIEMAGVDLEQVVADEPQSDPRRFTDPQRRLLDKIVREGIMVGYHHAKEHVRLVELFCTKLRFIVNGIGILAVRHLKDFLPMVSEIMTDPFAAKYPPALFSANQLLQSILRTCWPRIPHYCNDIIKTLMLCWLNTEDEESPENSATTTELKLKLTDTADMLSAVMKAAQVDITEQVSPLIEKEPQLDGLFRERGDAA